MVFAKNKKCCSTVVNGSVASFISSHTKGNIMRALLALSLILSSTTAMANPPPPVPDGLVSLHSLDCSDEETGQLGFCVLFVDGTGQNWLGFYQDDEIAMIRKLMPDGSYVTTWRADWFNSF